MRHGALAIIVPLATVLLVSAHALAQSPDADINKLIPQVKGKKVCFTGSFSNVPLDSEHYGAKPNPDGTVPVTYRNHKVTNFTLQLQYDDADGSPDQKDYPGHDRRYTFALSGKLADRRAMLYAAGECPWRAKDFVSADGNNKVPRTSNALHCGIDCDGGGMSLFRIADTESLLMQIAANERLRMSGPCGEEDTLVFNGRDKDRDFRLNPAPAAVCRPIERWLKRN